MKSNMTENKRSNNHNVPDFENMGKLNFVDIDS